MPMFGGKTKTFNIRYCFFYYLLDSTCVVKIVNFLGKKIILMTLRAGFEPARGDPIGFQVQRLNHSAIAAHGNSLR